MTGSDAKAGLHSYLRSAREAVLWKLDELSEYDIRRPLTPAGTNLLGLIKHLGGIEAGYFGDTLGARSMSRFRPDSKKTLSPTGSSTLRQLRHASR